jgi:tRNA A-37 threonylcarbamoyl transferase component Bud32
VALFDQFAEEPERWVESATDVLKRGNSATVVRIVIGGVDLVVKRYNITGPWQRLRRIFKRRAQVAWRNGLRLAFLGIPTARPLGLLETGPWWWPGPAYVLMEHLGGRDLATLTANDVIDRFTLQELTDIVGWLRIAGLSHGDFKSTNFMLHEGRLHVIDVDAVKVGAQTADIERLLANWPVNSPVYTAVRDALLATDIPVHRA